MLRRRTVHLRAIPTKIARTQVQTAHARQRHKNAYIQEQYGRVAHELHRNVRAPLLPTRYASLAIAANGEATDVFQSKSADALLYEAQVFTAGALAEAHAHTEGDVLFDSQRVVHHVGLGRETKDAPHGMHGISSICGDDRDTS